jgi:hypothetical protein
MRVHTIISLIFVSTIIFTHQSAHADCSSDSTECERAANDKYESCSTRCMDAIKSGAEEINSDFQCIQICADSLESKMTICQRRYDTCFRRELEAN